MRVRTELQALRHVLGDEAANFLLWIASYGGRFGPLPCSCEKNTRQERRVLEDAGLLRTERRRGKKGYMCMYQLLVDVRDPAITTALAQSEEEFQREEAAWYKERDQEAQGKALQGAG